MKLIEKILGQMSPEERDALHCAITQGGRPEDIAEVLTKNGHPVGKTVIKEYRKQLRERV